LATEEMKIHVGYHKCFIFPLDPFHSVDAYSFPNLKPDNPTSINGYFKSGATIFLPSHKSGHEKKGNLFPGE